MHKVLRIFILSLIVFVTAVLPLSAQQHREPWYFDDYFPKNYFYDDNEDKDMNDAVGEVVFYMRLADVKPLRDISLDKDECVLRLNYIPRFAHPLFIQVRQKGNQIVLTWQKGKAFRGYVEHTTYMVMSDNGWEDMTENEYYGNEWEKGVVDSGSRQLLPVEWQQIQEILTDIDFIHFPHCIHCGGFQTPYILEYKDNKNSISYYTECPDKEERVTNLLVSLVDTDYVDMVVYSTGEIYKTIAPAYPDGEEACAAFIQNAIHYPPEALQDLEEYWARVEFVVEKDGSIGFVRDDSWTPSDYGFADELIRVVKMMPKWEPAIENGKTVRCYAYVNYQFVLPSDIRPQYGHPILETQRDKRRWENIEAYHRKLLQNPLDENATLWMGKYYYWEYLLETQPVEPPTFKDSLFWKTEDDWISFYDRTPVVIHPGDSALKYFYKVLEMNPDIETIIDIYMPVLQLEQHLHKEHNPLAELPFDTVAGVHFPYSYLINWPEDGQLDASKDYYSDGWHSFFWVNAFSKDLKKMQEPVLYNNKLQEDEVVFRFSFFPSFHPPVSFRIEKNKSKVTLYWKILITKYVSTGHRKMTGAQYEQLLQYMEDVRLDELPHSEFERMMDGAQWVIERVTSQGFKAHFTNVAGKNIRRVYSFLTKLSGEKLEYIEEYGY